MNLVIHALTVKNEPLSQPITGRFDERGGTIGRSDTNTLALPDPERHISRLHAEVWFTNGAFSIRNVGSANAIIVNGRTISPGEGAALVDGDELSIGAYSMRVSVGEPSQLRLAERAVVDGRTVIKSSASEHKTTPPPVRQSTPEIVQPPGDLTQSPTGAAAADPFADLFGSPAASSSADPFADLFGSPPPSSLRPTPVMAVKRAPAAAPLASPPPASPSHAPAHLPDDFDPFADLGSPAPSPNAGLGSFMTGGSQPPPALSTAPATDLDFGDLLGNPASPPSSSLDDLFGLDPASGGHSATDPLADFLAPSPRQPVAGGGPSSENTDPLAMFGAGSHPPAPLLPPDFDRTPELKGAYNPPAVQPASGMAPAARTASPASTPKPIDRFPTTRPLAPPAEPDTRPPRGPVAPGSEPPFARATRSVSQMAETTMPAVRVSRPVNSDVTSAPLPRVPMPPTSPRRDAAPETPLPLPLPLPPTAPTPAIHPTAPLTAASAAATAGAAGQHSNEALWAAFCEGAGINMTLPQGLNPELMRVIGQVLQHSVDGTLKLVAVRAAAKSELRAQVTTIQSRNNNPLKFSPDAAAAIEQLLQPPMRGFMVGPAAVTDVMDDLLGHAIGTMAGMRAALAGVLQRFEPGQLESKLSGNSVMDAVLPMNRRAKLWELYLQHFKRIECDAEEDFHELFGKAFIRAYEDQLDRLDSARHPNV